MSASSLTSWTSASRSSLFDCSSECSSSKLRSKWSSMACLPRPVMMRMSVSPAATASSTTYWIDGLSTTGSISLGVLLVAGRNRVPIPAAGMTAFVTFSGFCALVTTRRYPALRPVPAAEVVLLTAREPAEVRRVAHEHDQRERPDDRDVTPGVTGERDHHGEGDD